ncbi:2-oxoglutarate and iron-dependent oxygenase domain-containing protein 3-like isoform X1 [Macrosteles quadrilineatus]|uniref:2-oxoglutarate and iron-dependent oxygenase domain-containing protein 3-like isoform X1 n=1 Tax=Macrosteles quadrilineatus TaxID=74068 RepID=UPI0023E21E4F|nr:2-oxoglutarate and iron-dependent oxygenase domain-containing protein 3-like isoform X1 [Macrosteles quadrilineatus]
MGKSELKEKPVRRRGNLNQKAQQIEKKEEKNEEDTSKPPGLKFGPMPTFQNQRVFTRGVMILATLAIVYFTSKSHKETILASQKELIQGRGQNFPCSADYSEELTEFPGCVPERCGRHVSDRLVTAAEAEQLLDIGRRGLARGSPAGGATILDLHSGALSYGRNFINVYTLNDTEQLFSVKDFAIYRVVRTKIQHAVAHQFGISADSLYLTHPTFFSQLTDLPPVTIHDEYWHPHVDKDTYDAFHYTSLLYLNNYQQDFKGGRFIFLEADNSTVVVEPRKGRVSMFTSGKENLHHIEPVTSGERFALTVSFTCDKDFAISDPSLPTTS